MSQYQELLVDLENKFIDSKCHGRITFLEGKELNGDDLNDKLNNVGRIKIKAMAFMSEIVILKALGCNLFKFDLLCLLLLSLWSSASH